jgi:2-oxoglutarate ferredoxin oxidoreductase subunit beta
MGQKTTTSPRGRTAEEAGWPIRVCELLDTLDGPAYIAREALTTPQRIRSAKKAVRRAFDTQLAGAGFSIVEMLSTCSTWWGMDPIESIQHIEDEMIEYYPLNVFRDRLAERDEAEGGDGDA